MLSSPQLHQSQLELQEVRLSYRQLQVKVEELTEERSLQSSAATSTSLLSEIEQSMEAEELEQEREQVTMSPPAGRSRPQVLFILFSTILPPGMSPRWPQAGVRLTHWSATKTLSRTARAQCPAQSFPLGL